MAAKRKPSGLNWELSGPCPTCAAPVFFAFKGKEIHVRRTCYHNLNQSYGSQWQWQQPYTIWTNSGTTGGSVQGINSAYTSAQNVQASNGTSLTSLAGSDYKAVANG